MSSFLKNILFLCLIYAPLLGIEYKTYKVKKNDTLYSIGRKFKAEPRFILRKNGHKVEGSLVIGEKLKIPVGTTTKSSILQYPTPTKPDIMKQFSSSPLYPYKGVLFSSEKSDLVTASAQGKVVAVDYLKGYEHYIIIRHKDGFSTVYGNLEKIFVKEGQTVDRKEKLGNYNPDKGLYFQVNIYQEPVNPLAYIK